uniref:HMA domain-containing protein n=1 Tax=mine drainage metagenome TaxID=410659 RepID=E6QMF8_9ZZZZ
MTNVDLLFRYEGEPSATVAAALGNAREVYGIRRLTFDRAAKTLLVEYDATRLNAAAVTQLVRRSGLQLGEELPLIAPPPVEAEAPVAPV